MRNKHRLIIDASSIIRACMYAGKDAEFGYKVTHEDKPVWVNSAGWGFENFVTSYKNLLKLTGTTPVQTILVKDGMNSRQLRSAIFPAYKAHRKKPAPEINQEYYDALEGIEDEIVSMGGTVMVQDGMEADDVIAYLCQNLEGKKTVWSRDGDMLALHNDDVDIYLKDTMNPETYESCPADYVLLYKALVGDSSDGLPGAKGFGPKAFINLVLEFGYEGCEAFMDLLEQRRLGELEEDVADFKPLRKVLDNQQTVYASYQCAKFYPQRVNTSRAPLEIRTGMVEQWDPEIYHYSLQEYFGTKTLVTADNFSEVLDWALQVMPHSPFTALDLEASDTDEGEAWAKAIDDSKTNSKSVTVDVYGQVMAGMSLTFGNNTQHTIYCSIDHTDTNNISLEQAKAFIDMVPEDCHIAVHNSNYELPVLNRHYPGFWLPNAVDTADLCSHVNENISQGLKPSAKHYFDYDQETYDEVTCVSGPVGSLGDEWKLVKTYKHIIVPKEMEEYVDEKTGKTRRRTIVKEVSELWETRRKRMNQLTADHVFDYGCDDTIVSAALYNRLFLTMELEGTTESYWGCDYETSYWNAEAFNTGVPVDLKRLKELELEDDKRFDEAWKIVSEFLYEVNWQGCSYVPFEEVTPATIKQAYLTLTGEPLTTMVRKPEKLADELTALGQQELADIVLTDNLEQFNEYMEGHFFGTPDFDVNKKAHLRTLLYDVLKVPVRFRNPPTEKMREAGKFEGSTKADNDALEHAIQLDLKEGSKEAEVLLNIRIMTQVETRRKLYYRPYPLYVHWSDGRIHCNLGKNRTATRRFAPSAPNLNQIAKRGPGKYIRSCFSAPAGYFVCAMDFSGQELRIGAELSRDEMLLSCYIGDNLRDPHSLTGASIAAKDGHAYGDYSLFELIRRDEEHADLDSVKKYRDKGKGVNFSSQYLCRAPKLAKMLVVPESEAQKFLDAKNEVYWGLAQWQQDTIEEAHAQGYVTTLMGARRHLHHKLTDPDQWARQEAERQAVNYRIQGSGAEMTKRAINSAAPLLKFYGAQFWMPVHDEAVFLIPFEAAIPCLQAIHACMIQPYGNMTVPLESEITIGPNFGDLTVVGTTPDAEAILTTIENVFGQEMATLAANSVKAA